jgi:glutaminase
VRINEEARLQALKVGFLRSSAMPMGCKEARRRIRVNATGLAFNSVMAVELNEDRTMNPMVNADGGVNADAADGKCGHRALQTPGQSIRRPTPRRPEPRLARRARRR